MKQLKKLTSLVLAVALVLGAFISIPAKAATTSVTVTLRIEKDASTLLAPTQITLTEDDLKNDFGIGLSTDETAAYSPLRAFAKYLASEKNVAKEDMSKYIKASPSSYGGLYVAGLSLTESGNGSASDNAELFDVYWMYEVNGTNGSISMSEYNCKSNDTVNIYGLWSPYSETEKVPQTYKASFDKNEYTATVGDKVVVTLNGSYEDWSDGGKVVTEKMANADVTLTDASEKKVLEAKTNENGVVELTAAAVGTYYLSATRKNADGIHYDISRPYAVLTVKAKTQNQTTVEDKKDTVINNSGNKNEQPKALKNATITIKKGKKKIDKITVKKSKTVSVKVSVNSKAKLAITKLSKKQKKAIKVSLKNGKLTIKGKKKGTVKITITAKKTVTYKAAKKIFTIKVK